MKAYASHLLATEELEWFQKHSKTDIPSNTRRERVIHTQKSTPLMLAGPRTDAETRGHRGCGTRTASSSHLNGHCPLRTASLPGQSVYSLILISGESSGLHPKANWFNKQHLGLAGGNMILQREHGTETSIPAWVQLRASQKGWIAESHF